MLLLHCDFYECLYVKLNATSQWPGLRINSFHSRKRWGIKGVLFRNECPIDTFILSLTTSTLQHYLSMFNCSSFYIISSAIAVFSSSSSSFTLSTSTSISSFSSSTVLPVSSFASDYLTGASVDRDDVDVFVRTIFCTAFLQVELELGSRTSRTT